MFDDYEIESILHAGLIFLVYLFLVIILYFVLSYPVDLIFDALSAGSVGTAAEDPMSWQLPGIEWAVRVVFALALAYPFTWFVFWVYNKEVDFSMFRRQ